MCSRLAVVRDLVISAGREHQDGGSDEGGGSGEGTGPDDSSGGIATGISGKDAGCVESISIRKKIRLRLN